MPHRQKALTPINIQLDNMVSDLTGKTGLAILAGSWSVNAIRKTLALLRLMWVAPFFPSRRVARSKPTLCPSFRL